MTEEAAEPETNNENVEDLERECDAVYKPVVQLKPVKIVTCEEEEEELLKLRCKLYRYAYDAEDVEWKERGIGDIKMLKHRQSGRIRIVMRREKVLSVCCNHYLKPGMQLSRATGTTSDRAVVWSTMSDFADGDAKRETFAARFQSAEIADTFTNKWNELIAQLKKRAPEKQPEEKEPTIKKEPTVKEEEKTEEITEAMDKMKLKNGNAEDEKKKEDK